MKKFFLFLVTFACAANAGTVRGDLIHAFHGSPQPHVDFASSLGVGEYIRWIEIVNPDGTRFTGGTGFLYDIGADGSARLGTAAHVLDGVTSNHIIRVGDPWTNPNDPDKTYSIGTQFYMHPTWTWMGQGYDQGVIYLDGIEKIPLPTLYEGEINVGMQFHSAGYGETGLVGGDPPVYEGLLTASRSIVHGLSTTPYTENYFQSRFNQPGHQNFDVFDSFKTPGHSGSPSMLLDDNGDFMYAGIAAMSAGPLYGGRTFYTKIDNQFFFSHGTSVPEPGSAALFLPAIILLSSRRRINMN